MAPSQTPSPAPPSIQLPTPTTTLSPNYTSPSFDPVDFLNDVLPPLALASQQSQSQSQSSRAVNLGDLSIRVQSILSQSNAQNIRFSTTLTTLTDEILRGGNRLAYEVEVLRGETVTLSDLVTEGLGAEIGRFTIQNSMGGEGGERKQEQQDEKGEKITGAKEPEYVANLRTLNQVRARLEDVVQTFGDAMEWPLPPSETSLASSFISVSAPDLGPDSHSREEKGQEVVRKLRGEVAGLLESDPGAGGVEAATRRVEALRTLAMVWKGSAEEKARGRFVEGLMKMVEERRRALEAASVQSAQQGFHSGSRGHQRQESEGPGGGIFRNLQRLRDEIYLE
ncbi:hypothetical protein BDW59DRAFT_155709 [Aspergillus cavernicola]|uniref:Uncharacterized protein n=1 Tax=Aspergillus cavernicola TaxID=176166 RepID=A0ABR4J4H8_9EURO